MKERVSTRGGLTDAAKVIRYEFLEGPIPATLLSAEFDLYSRTEMQDFIITNIEWDDEKKKGQKYIFLMFQTSNGG